MRLMRASEVTKRPVVTLAGEDIAQVKDIVYAAGGAIAGFTLSGRGIFSGPMKQGLPWSSVAALGADAVMITDDSALQPRQSVLEAATSSGNSDSSGGNVLGSQVLTDSGVDLGTVVDIVIQVAQPKAGKCEVVGYEIETPEASGAKRTRMLIPLPDTLAASGEHLIVPAAAKDFVTQDLAGFGAAILAFRTQLEGSH